KPHNTFIASDASQKAGQPDYGPATDSGAADPLLAASVCLVETCARTDVQVDETAKGHSLFFHQSGQTAVCCVEFYGQPCRWFQLLIHVFCFPAGEEYLIFCMVPVQFSDQSIYFRSRSFLNPSFSFFNIDDLYLRPACIDSDFHSQPPTKKNVIGFYYTNDILLF